jgi:hypothetical protein
MVVISSVSDHESFALEFSGNRTNDTDIILLTTNATQPDFIDPANVKATGAPTSSGCIPLGISSLFYYSIYGLAIFVTTITMH